MNNSFSLWKLLEEYDVVIPVIQRDYAQGRKDKEYIRKTFLCEIKNALCSVNPKTLDLDFVYGNIDGRRFYPLDGQQRLTTLWLIYWYISFRANTIMSDRDTLKKFSYETRASSGDFCTALCNEMQDVTSKDIEEFTGIVEFIKSQTWFYSEWLQDPTVSSMLRTLGGDGSKSTDNIEICFDNCDYSLLRKRLIEKHIVSFELMVIGGEKLPISDDLYIKMNARGKGLTDFENFKADVVAWIQDTNNPDSNELKNIENIENIEKNISYRNYFPSQIDNKWTDVFWNSARKRMQSEFDGNIDAIYFSFINRLVINEICLDTSMSPVEYAPGKEDNTHKTTKASFDKLFGTGLRGSSADDSLVNYEGFEVYKNYLNFQALQEIDFIFEKISIPSVIDAINTSLSIEDVDKAEEDHVESGYSYLPSFSVEQGHALLPTSQKERVYFLAVCQFILNCRATNVFDKNKFGRWMRVVRNLTENAAVDNVPAMVTCMRLIKRLSDKMFGFDNDIYTCLKNYGEQFSNSQLECQLFEEKEKAEKILTDNTWEPKIKEAENFAFFNGTIRFLFRNIETVDWNDFDKKYDTAKKLFKKSVPASTVEKLLRQFTGFEEIKDNYLFTSVGYHQRHKCWKKDILCSGLDDLLSKVHSLLIEQPEPTHNVDYQDFLNSGIIKKVVDKTENYKYRYHWHSYWAVHKDYSQTEGVYLSAERKSKNDELKRLSDAGTVVVIDPNFNFFQNGYYWGVKVEFEYRGLKYRWYESYESGQRTDKIYCVMNDKESTNAFVWTNCSNLINGIDSFIGWN